MNRAILFEFHDDSIDQHSVRIDTAEPFDIGHRAIHRFHVLQKLQHALFTSAARVKQFLDCSSLSRPQGLPHQRQRLLFGRRIEF